MTIEELREHIQNCKDEKALLVAWELYDTKLREKFERDKIPSYPEHTSINYR